MDPVFDCAYLQAKNKKLLSKYHTSRYEETRRHGVLKHKLIFNDNINRASNEETRGKHLTADVKTGVAFDFKRLHRMVSVRHQSTFTFAFSHLADAFIQSDLQLGST